MGYKVFKNYCVDCGKEISRYAQRCKSCSLIGREIGKETRDKIGRAHKGMKYSEESKKRMSISHLGKKQPYEQTQKIIKSKLGKYRRENSWAWKGGISKENELQRKSYEYNIWRNEVFKRDNYTCQLSNKIGGKLIPHHIYNFSEYPKLRFDVNNGITLSESIHRKFHHIYGYKTTKKDFDEFKEKWATGKF